jgi:preprotein translocase subunit SecG
MTKKIASTARIRRTTVLAARLWVVLALALAVTTLASYLRVGTDEAAARNGAAPSEGDGSDDG